MSRDEGLWGGGGSLFCIDMTVCASSNVAVYTKESAFHQESLGSSVLKNEVSTGDVGTKWIQIQ